MTTRPETQWGTEDPTYSLEHFYVRSTDGKGNSNEIRVRVPPTIAGQIEAMVQQRQVPDYRTAADVLRDAIVHRLRYLNDHIIDDPRLERRINSEIQAAEIRRFEDEAEHAREMVADTRTALDKVYRLGDYEVLRDMVKAAKDVADGLREPYKSELESIIAQYKGN